MAHFYLAKGHLQRADLSSAEPELQEVIEMRGRLGSQARTLLQSVQALRAAMERPAGAPSPPED